MTSARHYRNPVSLAKLIMTDSEHCALSGEGALKFAKKKGFPVIYDGKQLITETAKTAEAFSPHFDRFVDLAMRGRPVMAMDDSSKTALATALEGHDVTPSIDVWGSSDSGDTVSAVPSNDSDDTSSAAVRNDCGDTVSAVARDTNGHFACAVSTGMISQNFIFIHFFVKQPSIQNYCAFMSANSSNTSE